LSSESLKIAIRYERLEATYRVFINT
jgi:hypothetical protein